jgi:hypothetical protein
MLLLLQNRGKMSVVDIGIGFTMERLAGKGTTFIVTYYSIDL